MLQEISLVSFLQSKRATRAGALLFTAFSAIVAFFTSTAVRAADVSPGWGSWSLPPNHSVHGGAIEMSSEEGKGSTFTVLLRAVEPRNREISESAEPRTSGL